MWKGMSLYFYVSFFFTFSFCLFILSYSTFDLFFSSYSITMFECIYILLDREEEGVNVHERRGREDLGRVWRGKTIIRI